jgi:hypothetical protein
MVISRLSGLVSGSGVGRSVSSIQRRRLTTMAAAAGLDGPARGAAGDGGVPGRAPAEGPGRGQRWRLAAGGAVMLMRPRMICSIPCPFVIPHTNFTNRTRGA